MPKFTKLDYVRSMIFSQTQIYLSLLLREGLSLDETWKVAQDLQATIHRAYHGAVAIAGTTNSGQPPNIDLDGIDPDDPINPFGSEN